MSDFLYANPSWLSGFARTLDLWAQFDQYNSSLTPEQADWLALMGDMRAVSNDVWTAWDESIPEVAAAEQAAAEAVSMAR